MRHPCQLIVASLVVLLLAAPAAADIVVPGQKKVRRDAVIDFGPYADYTTWTYVVKKGDTLSEIAEHHLGTLKRQAEITALNEGVTAATLKAGDKLLMPPRKVPRPVDPAEAKDAKTAADARMWWDLFGGLWGGSQGFERMGHGEKVPHHHYWTTLVAVRHDKLAAFEKAMAEGKQNAQQTLKALAQAHDWIAVADASLTGYASLPDMSPIASIVEHYRIDAITGSTITLRKVDTKQFDKDREPVSGAGMFGGWNLLLLFLAFVGLLGLVIVVSRRRAPGRVQIPVGS